MRCFTISVFLAALLLSVNAYSFEIIDFEPPHYTASQGLPAPWTAGTENAGITDVGPVFGTQSLYSGGGGSTTSGTICTYPFDLPEGDEFTFTLTLRVPSYSPSNYGHGYVGLGRARFTGANAIGSRLGNIYFDLQKPYGSSVSPSHYKIVYVNYDSYPFTTIGNFVSGGTYTLTYNINWQQKTSSLNIQGTGGVDITVDAQNGLSGINRDDFEGVGLSGHSIPSSVGNYSVLYDDIIIGEEPEELVGDFNSDGVVDYEDFAVFADCWLSELGGSNWTAACNLDIEGDSGEKIDIADLLIFSENWLGE
ncbi:hypothetical protein [Sedimentisphaera salicampi]|uniref:Dockerin domain-containing protein n=1 Tax=Sedimentisphaera salicampi TaxID=1941349 RepID=A0A1W6LNS3_9BACT|nr:hypothetical protein [Sedimentisphaera salicampi]ARN57414.1 hypothetical protein STSP1_01821 [Sedimentisphaera salicampi]